ncbi:unnamed protein product [Brassica oleracea var. botrytis]
MKLETFKIRELIIPKRIEISSVFQTCIFLFSLLNTTTLFDGPLGHMLAMVWNGLLGCMLATGCDELSSQRLAMDQQAVMDRYVYSL